MAVSILLIGRFFLKIFEKIVAIKSLLNPHFKGFGAITRSDSCRSCFSDHFGMVDVPFRPMDDHFVTILVFVAVLVTFFVTFFGNFSCKKADFLQQIPLNQIKNDRSRKISADGPREKKI